MSTIYLNIIIDTAAIQAHYGRNTNPAAPVGIGHQYGFMVISDNKAVSGQGTGDLVFQAQTGDILRVSTASESNNFVSSTLLVDMPKFGGDQVFGKFRPTAAIQGKLPFPNNDENVLPAKWEIVDRYFLQADINRAGTENFKVQFALYDASDNVYGYFTWDPQIRVELV